MAIDLSPDQALINLDNAVSQIQTTRDHHVALQNSISVLQKVIAEWRQLSRADKQAKVTDISVAESKK